MSHLTTRELLYMEDASKMFESVMKNCNFASNTAVDPDFKSLMQSLAWEHKEWVRATASLVNNTNAH